MSVSPPEQGPEESLPGVFLMVNSLETGGSERQFAALAQSLDPQHFRRSLGCIQKKGSFLALLGEMPEFRLGGSLYGWKSLRTRFRLARHLRRNDIAVAHAFDFYTNLTLIPAARLAGTPVVIGSQRQLGDLLTPAQSRFQTAVLRWADCVVCNSRAAAQGLIDRGLPERRIAVIGNGLPPSAFATAVPALERSPGLLRVGMIARMNARSKNHSAFLRIAASLRDKFPQVQFVLVGDGPLRGELESEAAALGVSRSVLFLGDRRDIPAIMASLDVSVLPSASESLSNAILEAMAARLPVVAYNVGGNPELISDNRGALVAAGNEQAMAAIVERLLLDASMREQLGGQAQEFTQANFSLKEVRRRYEGLYTDLLARKSWQPRARSGWRSNSKSLRVAIVAASLRYVGGQSVQADLLLRYRKEVVLRLQADQKSAEQPA